MTPKEKAQEILEKMTHTIAPYISSGYMDIEYTKGASLITVNEILQTEEYLTSYNDINGYSPFEFWEEVKKEIEKL